MKKRVLAAMDLAEGLGGSASYAIHLAQRTKASLVLVAVTPHRGSRIFSPSGGTKPLMDPFREKIGMAIQQCQSLGVPVDVFVSTGPLLWALGQFLRGDNAFQFLVIEVPKTDSPSERECFSTGMARIKEIFPGEVLLVRDRNPEQAAHQLH